MKQTSKAKTAATYLKKPFKRRKAPEERVTEAFANVPRITNETVAEHREEVLSTARKYIYPLRHSKHRVVRISISLFVIVVVAFFIYCIRCSRHQALYMGSPRLFRSRLRRPVRLGYLMRATCLNSDAICTTTRRSSLLISQLRTEKRSSSV
jgi:hypothetical protein